MIYLNLTVDVNAIFFRNMLWRNEKNIQSIQIEISFFYKILHFENLILSYLIGIIEDFEYFLFIDIIDPFFSFMIYDSFLIDLSSKYILYMCIYRQNINYELRIISSEL